MSEKPSEHLTRAFSMKISSCVVTCHCGKIYVYAANENVFDDGELERYLKLEKEDPDQVEVSYIYGGNGYVQVDGKVYVFDCPCSFEHLSRVEEWLWRNRLEIADYLKRRAADLKHEAEAVSAPLEGLDL